MTHNGRMGLIDRIFGGGKETKAREPVVERASTQFFESEPDALDSPEGRNAPRRELVQVVLRDTMRKHGIPSDWIESRIMSAITRSGRRGLHVYFVVKQAHEQLLTYVFAFQDSFERELTRFEPRCRDWLMSVGWEFPGAKASEMPDAKSWQQLARAAGGASAAAAVAGPAAASAPGGAGAGARAATSPAAAATPAPPVAAPAPAMPAPAQRTMPMPPVEALEDEDARSDDEIQRDLQALFAIRDKAMAETGRRGPADDHTDFQPTQPFDDDPGPRR